MANEIELFDRYIDDLLSPAEKRVFEERLASDRDFASSFRLYLLSIQGVRCEAEESDMEFGIAMKHLSEKDLRRIIRSVAHPEFYVEELACGNSGDDEPYSDSDVMPGEEPPSSGRLGKWLHGRIGWISTIAAIIVVGLFVVVHMERETSRSIDELIVEYNYYPAVARGVSDADSGYSDLTALSSDQLREALPVLKKTYEKALGEDDQETEIAGMQLAMAYLMLHERQEALPILQQLKSRFADDPEFSARCEAIIRRIE